MTHDVVVAYLNIFLYLSMIYSLSPDFCFCNVFCHGLMLLLFILNSHMIEGKKKMKAVDEIFFFNSLFVSHASNQHCRFVSFLHQKVGKEPECLAFSTKYNVELQNVGDALLVSSHDLGFTLCSSFVSARIWQLYALKVTHQLNSHLKRVMLEISQILLLRI